MKDDLFLTSIIESILSGLIQFSFHIKSLNVIVWQLGDAKIGQNSVAKWKNNWNSAAVGDKLKHRPNRTVSDPHPNTNSSLFSNLQYEKAGNFLGLIYLIITQTVVKTTDSILDELDKQTIMFCS
jgi:hypothetical protein